MPETTPAGSPEAPRKPARRDLRDRMETAVISEFELVGGYALAIFRLARPDAEPFFEFKAGQYAQLALWDQPEADVRPRQYSIASSPYDLDELEFYVLLVEEAGALGEGEPGVFTAALWGHRVGDEVLYMPRPAGHFVLDRTTGPNIVAVATGTGLAPFVSMARQMDTDVRNGKKLERGLTLVHGVSYVSDLGYKEFFERLHADPQIDFTYIPTISRPRWNPTWSDGLSAGRANDVIRLAMGEPVSSAVQPEMPDPLLTLLRDRLNPADAAVYVCGHPGMIKDCSEVLAAHGFKTEGRDSQVITEDYW